MPDAVPPPGLQAGRQTRAHLQLSRALWLRKPGDRHAFRFDPAADPALAIGQPEGEADGVMTVAEDETLVFRVPGDPAAFLRALAGWARGAVAGTPALALLTGSGAAPADPAAAVIHDDALWDGLLEPDEATIAAALAAVSPGERLWFWMTAEPGDYAIPLIVQPLAWDPNHDRTALLIDRNQALGAGEGAGGTAVLADDGTFQFMGDDLRPAMLRALAEWVGAYAGEHPALARLAHCRLLLTDDDRVAEVYAEPAFWRDVAAAPAPGTLGATAAVLEALPDGGECWFWMTGAETAPFLHLAPVPADPEGEAFRAGLPALYARFPASFADAGTGVMTRAGDRFAFVAAEGDAAGLARPLARLLDAYGAAFPVLRRLDGSALLRADAPAAAST